MSMKSEYLNTGYLDPVPMCLTVSYYILCFLFDTFPPASFNLVTICVGCNLYLINTLQLCSILWSSPSTMDIPFIHAWYLLHEYFFFLFLLTDFIYLFISERACTGVGERGRGRSLLSSEQGAWCGAPSQDTEIMTCAKAKSQTLNQPHHPGALKPNFNEHFPYFIQS